jgi:hypothetical protein
MSSPFQSTPQRTDPLSAWFLLLTAAGVLCALLSSAVELKEPPYVPVLLTILAAVSFGTVGVCFSPHIRNGIVGLFCGGIMGLVTGLLLQVPTDTLTVQTFAVLAGSVMIVVVGLVGRSVR